MSWDTCKFSSLYAIPSRNGLSIPATKHGRGNKIINMGELFAYGRIPDVPMELVELSDSMKANYNVEKDDLLFARRSLVLEGAGKCSWVKEVPDITTFESSIIRVRLDKERAVPLFYYYYFKSTQSPIKTIVQQCAQSGIRASDLADLSVHSPPLHIQRRIADILSAYDDLIENNLRQIKLLEEAAMRLYREWFVFMRFPGHESVRIVDGVPEGWEVKQINDVCLNCASGGTPSRKRREYWADGSVNWFKTQELVDSWLFDADEKISEKGLENSSAKLFPENTIVMAIYASPTLGRLGILTKESTFNQAALGLVANGDFVSYEWLYLKLFELRDKFNAIASGAGQQNINVKIVQTKEIVVPSHDVMGKFTEIIHPYFEKQKNLTEQIIYLQKARDALLPRLMNGGEGLKLEGGAV